MRANPNWKGPGTVDSAHGGPHRLSELSWSVEKTPERSAVWLEGQRKVFLLHSLAGVIEENLPALGSLAPHQREDAVVLFCLALFAPLQVETTGDDGEFRFAAPGG